MKLDISKCPVCGKEASGIIEVMTCVAYIGQGPDGSNDTVYLGQTDILWDSQQADEIDGQFEVQCDSKHRWMTNITW